VEYDPDAIGYDELLEVFFATHDPTQLNRQGPDVGTQYTALSCCLTTRDQRRQAEAYIEALDEEVRRRRCDRTQVLSRRSIAPRRKHQDYFEKNPNDAYCTMHAAPKVEGSRKVRTEDEIGGRSALTERRGLLSSYHEHAAVGSHEHTLSPNSHERTDSERPRVFSQAADHPGVI